MKAKAVEKGKEGAKRNDGWKLVAVRLTPAEHKALRIKAANEETTVTSVLRAMVQAVLLKEK